MIVAAVVLLGPASPGGTHPVPHSANRVVPSPDPAATNASASVRDTLDQREQAWRSADRAAWLATVTGPAVARQTQAFESLGRLGLASWSEELTALEAAAGGSWRASVVVRYRFAGDPVDARAEAVLDLTPDLRVAGVSTTPVPPWEIDDVVTATSRHSLVVGGADAATLRDYAAELDRAAESVASLLDEPPPRVVLVVAADWEQARRMVAGGAGAGLAALTASLEPPDVPRGPVRVLADQGVLASLDLPTRSALLGHEVFHVATHGLGPVPLWLSEGLADYAGYRDAGVPLDRSIAGLLRRAALDGPPTVLPDDAAFRDAARATEAYEGAHLALQTLVADYGEAAVLELYRTAADRGSASLDAVLGELLGTDVASVTAHWRAEVAARAGR